eukprot:5296731-Pyramimonas_sp.AAC.1
MWTAHLAGVLLLLVPAERLLVEAPQRLLLPLRQHRHLRRVPRRRPGGGGDRVVLLLPHLMRAGAIRTQ